MTTLIESLITRFFGVVPAIELKVSQQETKAVRQRMADVQAELDYIKGKLGHTYEGEWKVTKNGKKRYRKVATRFIATKWKTVSVPIDIARLSSCRMSVTEIVANYHGAAMAETSANKVW